MPKPQQTVIARLLASLLLAAGGALADERPVLTWPEAQYNPKLAAGDVLLPVPCGGAMVFRVIATGPEPRRAAGRDFSALTGPLALGPGGSSAYLLGKYEVTRQQAAALQAFADGSLNCRVGDYQPCAEAAGCPLPDAPDGRLPRGYIAWDVARFLADEYGIWLARQAPTLPDCTGAGDPCLPRIAGQPAVVRLPSAAEWEYAARGGQAVRAADFAKADAGLGNALPGMAWFNDNARGDPRPIGLLAPNGLGLHDLFGNVAELLADLAPADPAALAEAQFTARGGAYNSTRSELGAGAAVQAGVYDGYGGRRTSDTGFRLLVGGPLPEVIAADGNRPARGWWTGWLWLLFALGLGALLMLGGLRGWAVLAKRWVQRAALAKQATLSKLREQTRAKQALLAQLREPAEARAQPEAQKQATREPPARRPFEPEMILIPAGRFLMGSPASEPERGDWEGPQHWVDVPAFALGKYPVTFAEWDACVADGGCSHRPDDQGWGRGNRPVIIVSWDDAQQYIQWLSRKTGHAYRLPSEAEWEYACRAGTTTPFHTGNCINSSQANYDGNDDYNNCGAITGVRLGKTQPVGSYPANPWGLHDMHGNVWEWVADNWHDNYNGAPTDGSAWEAASGAARVLRGGSFFNWAPDLRSALRGGDSPSNRYQFRGFRCARAPAASIDR